MEREAIARGLKESIEIVKGSTNQSSSEILALLALTQYLDTLKTIGLNDNSKVIFMDTSVNKTSDLLQQLTGALEINKSQKKV